jgi:ABC-type glycerol-3-phosphate transport system permease component
MAQQALSRSPTAAIVQKPRALLTYQRVNQTLTYLALTLIAILYALPFLWLLTTSLKPLNQVFSDPIRWIPEPVAWQNYRQALSSEAFPFALLLRNTLFYCVTSTFGVVISSAVVAYGFARLEFWGRNTLFGITLSTMMLPSVVTLIPTYILFRRLDWVGTYAPLIVPYFLGSAFNIFLLRQFMLTIPWDLTDAARVDGAGDFTILWRVMLPLIKPALLVVALLHFLFAWNDFQNPLIYLDDANEAPLVLGLFAFQSRHGVQWHLLMAAALTVTAPLIVLFFVCQRYFIEGVTLSGLKG